MAFELELENEYMPKIKVTGFETFQGFAEGSNR